MSAGGDDRRVSRVEKEIRDIVANYLIRHFANDFLSVRQVRVAKDLKAASLYVSSIKYSPVPPDLLERLQDDAKNMQSEIDKRLRMKYCPRLKFINDDGGDRGEKIDELLAQIRQK
ncbi:MAG: 30S ribosome-binding factor RbfA [Bdellovibrionaceae bacterium]|nr:30S ribosome-binding factor RbfA [Pseudobdellovibrionaceae bacterium]